MAASDRNAFQSTARDFVEQQLEARKIREAMVKIKNKAGANRAYDAGEHEDNVVGHLCI
jgi:hypothetical protein